VLHRVVPAGKKKKNPCCQQEKFSQGYEKISHETHDLVLASNVRKKQEFIVPVCRVK
jgi:hypothetical protein